MDGNKIFVPAPISRVIVNAKLQIQQSMCGLSESSGTENAIPISAVIDRDCDTLQRASVCPSSPVVLHPLPCFIQVDGPVLDISVAPLLLASACVQEIGGKEKKKNR